MRWIALGVAALACAPTEGARLDSRTYSADAAAATTSSGSDSALVARADSARIKGNPAAALWIVEISDFQCPYCRQWHEMTYEPLMREYVETGKARFAYLNLPLPNHANAVPAAEAAMCSGLQGKFWEMHDALFEHQEHWAASADPWPVFVELATEAGIDGAQMRNCADSDVILALVHADASRAVEVGVRSTPTFLVGNIRLEGAYPFPDMKKVVDSLLAARGP